MAAPTLSTERSTFRQLVADVAAKAKAVLPGEVNGRLEGAVALVLAGDVEPQEDGSVVVHSSSDPLKRYVLQGVTCTCTDFQSKAPEGWCKHRIAAGIDKRVRALVAHLLQPAPAPVLAPALPEAPASVNCHLMIAGRQVQLTLRDTDEAKLLARLEKVLAQYPAPPLPSQSSQGKGKDWCPTHQVSMKQTTKDGRSWYSHKKDGRWCKGR
jgi:hypothetical protein